MVESRLHELKDTGYWNKDINSLDYQQGQDLFVQGKAAMIFGNDTFLPRLGQAVGLGQHGRDDGPKYGTGKLADTYIVTAQGLGITSWSKHPKEAADFLMFMHTPERLNAWYAGHGRVPRRRPLRHLQDHQPAAEADLRVGSRRSPAPTWRTSSPACWTSRPTSPARSCCSPAIRRPRSWRKLAEDVIAKWREQNPDAVKNFEKWQK